MSSRPLCARESSNLRHLNSAGIDCALIYLTRTGLKKSILDATSPLRNLLSSGAVHEFIDQPQGPEHKVIHRALAFDQDGQSALVDVSLYRPNTKSGDPRIWPSRLGRCASPKDVLAFFVSDRQLHFVNLTKQDPAAFQDQASDLHGVVREIGARQFSVANELLYELQKLASKGPLEAVCTGDTAIGRTLENALGIDMNSSKDPDYKGIELKAKRTKSFTRSFLFAQVADWSRSHLWSSRRILEVHGSDKPDKTRRLNCTVRASLPNKQGLMLLLDYHEECLREVHVTRSGERPVCIWALSKLHKRLQRKHGETFWISAIETTDSQGTVFFELQSVIHTKRPSNSQFDRLVETGQITLDHAIKRDIAGRVKERGPLFKISRRALPELFLGVAKEHQLP